MTTSEDAVTVPMDCTRLANYHDTQSGWAAGVLGQAIMSGGFVAGMHQLGRGIADQKPDTTNVNQNRGNNQAQGQISKSNASAFSSSRSKAIQSQGQGQAQGQLQGQQQGQIQGQQQGQQGCLLC